MSQKIPFQQARYLTSSTTLSQLPRDDGAEIAFVGRSNAGKSSALNTITSVHGLARTSNTPGRTQMINFFELDDTHRLVDLPGYGFAKVSKAAQTHWVQMIADYLETRQSLAGLILVMDSRHPLKELDWQLIDWCVNFQVPLHILLTKADKLTFSAQQKVLRSVQHSLVNIEDVNVQLFSSLKKMGVDEARLQLTRWFVESDQ